MVHPETTDQREGADEVIEAQKTIAAEYKRFRAKENYGIILRTLLGLSVLMTIISIVFPFASGNELAPFLLSLIALGLWSSVVALRFTSFGKANPEEFATVLGTILFLVLSVKAQTDYSMAHKYMENCHDLNISAGYWTADYYFYINFSAWLAFTMVCVLILKLRFVHSLCVAGVPGLVQAFLGITFMSKYYSDTFPQWIAITVLQTFIPGMFVCLATPRMREQLDFANFKLHRKKDNKIKRGKTKIHAQKREIEKVKADLKRLSNGSSLLDKLNARPPRAFAQIEFEELYGSTDSVERECLSAAALDVCQEYLLVKPITDEKWVYFKTILSPLHLWDDRQVFEGLQQIAAESRRGITDEQNAIISALGNGENSAAGSWLCCELEPIKADANIYEVAGNWLPPKYLTPVEDDTKGAKKEFDQTVLPESLRFHAGKNFDAFREALGRLLPPGTFFFEEPPLQPDENLSSRATARRLSSASLVSAGKSMIRCDRDKCVKKSARIKAKVTLALEEKRAPYPCTSTIGDSLRASIVAPNPEAMRMIWEHLASSEELRVIRMKNKFQTTFNELGADTSSATFPDVHVNVMFGSTIVAEIQCHLHEVIALKKESHKLYQITRAESIEALRPQSS